MPQALSMPSHCKSRRRESAWESAQAGCMNHEQAAVVSIPEVGEVPRARVRDFHLQGVRARLQRSAGHMIEFGQVGLRK